MEKIYTIGAKKQKEDFFMKPDFNFIELPEVISVFCEVCDQIADFHPNKRESMERLKKEANNNPIFPTVPNLSSLLTTYNYCFDKSDLLYYIHILATALHCLSGYTLSIM